MAEDDLRRLIDGFRIPPTVAAVSYPRGCRIRRVRVRAQKAPTAARREASSVDRLAPRPARLVGRRPQREGSARVATSSLSTASATPRLAVPRARLLHATPLTFCRLTLWSFLALLVTTTLADADLWGHLRFGLDILGAKSLHTTDPYSFTSDRAWINHEWLSELLTAIAYRAFGTLGLGLLKLGMIAIVLTVLFAVARREQAPPLARDLFVALALFVTYSRTQVIRPQLFSVALFFVILWILKQVGSRSHEGAGLDSGLLRGLGEPARRMDRRPGRARDVAGWRCVPAQEPSTRTDPGRRRRGLGAGDARQPVRHRALAVRRRDRAAGATGHHGLEAAAATAAADHRDRVSAAAAGGRCRLALASATAALDPRSCRGDAAGHRDVSRRPRRCVLSGRAGRADGGAAARVVRTNRPAHSTEPAACVAAGGHSSCWRSVSTPPSLPPPTCAWCASKASGFRIGPPRCCCARPDPARAC